MKLNIGCGNVPLRGYINIDKFYYPGSPYPLTDQRAVSAWFDELGSQWLYGDATELDLESDTFDEVMLIHCLEHLDMGQGSRAIMEAYRVLKPGGFIDIEVPDLLKACALMPTVHVTPGGDNQPWHRVMGALYGTDGSDGEGQYHLCGYTQEYLRFKLQERDFINVQEIPVGFGHGEQDEIGHPEPEYDFRLRAYKP